LGVPLDYGEAYKWFTLSAQAGLAQSKSAIKTLTQIMTTAQLRNGQSRVSDWVSRNNSSTLASQTAETQELDTYVSARQP